MKQTFFGLVLFLGGTITVSAFTLTLTEVAKPYDVIPIEDSFDEVQAHMGILESSPIMYEFTAIASTTLSAQLRQRYTSSAEPVQLALIAIRKDDRGGGVTEVGRLRPRAEDWTRKKESRFGMSFLTSESLTAEVGPGVYRVEVSTPENIGRYMLVLGSGDESVGYFETIKTAWVLQDFFGYSFLRIIASSHVYYPLGIVLILFGIHRTWKFRKSISNVP